jgi:DNA-binding response OmpR family regulator
MSDTPRFRSNQVLLVDVDLRTCRRLARLLGEDGFQVEIACDGASAISRLSRSPLPGTLITELAVPLKDGETVARFARSRDPAMQIVVLTNHPHLLKPETFGSPSPVVLTKPLDYARLLELLREPQTEASIKSGLFLRSRGGC